MICLNYLSLELGKKIKVGYSKSIDLPLKNIIELLAREVARVTNQGESLGEGQSRNPPKENLKWAKLIADKFNERLFDFDFGLHGSLLNVEDELTLVALQISHLQHSVESDLCIGRGVMRDYQGGRWRGRLDVKDDDKPGRLSIWLE